MLTGTLQLLHLIYSVCQMNITKISIFHDQTADQIDHRCTFVLKVELISSSPFGVLQLLSFYRKDLSVSSGNEGRRCCEY